MLSLGFCVGIIRQWKDDQWRHRHSTAEFSSVVVAKHRAPPIQATAESSDDSSDSSDDEDAYVVCAASCSASKCAVWSCIPTSAWCGCAVRCNARLPLTVDHQPRPHPFHQLPAAQLPSRRLERLGHSRCSTKLPPRPPQHSTCHSPGRLHLFLSSQYMTKPPVPSLLICGRA